MKTKTLSILAGIATPLFFGGETDAGFVGIEVVAKDNPFGILTCNVYAIFDRPGEDRVEAIAGTSNNPLRIEVIDGEFYNTPKVGTDQAPTTFLISMFPSLAYDTFVTIGVKAVGTAPGAQPTDNLTITPGFPTGITGSVLEGTNFGWGVTPKEAQGDPFDPVNAFPGNGQILIGQFATADGIGIQGTFLFQYTSNGIQFQQSILSFQHPPMIGACCLADGSCQALFLSECNNLGGTYQGPGTNCKSACNGACCFLDGSCLDVSSLECDDLGGEFQGIGVDCESETCPVLIGACCLVDGSCLDAQLPSKCDSLGGMYQGNGTDCSAVICPVLIGACCLPETCLDGVTLEECELLGGNYQGNETDCDIVDCIGACCLLDGSCLNAQFPSECDGLGGTYQGNGIDCSAVSCPVLVGACCLPDGKCLDAQLPSECNSLFGFYQGDATTCLDSPCCPQEVIYAICDEGIANSQLAVLDPFTGVLVPVGPQWVSTDIEGMTFYKEGLLGVSGDLGGPHDMSSLDFCSGSIAPGAPVDFGPLAPTEVLGMTTDGLGVQWAYLEGHGFATITSDGTVSLEVPYVDPIDEVDGLAGSEDGITLWAITGDGRILEVDIASDTVAMIADLSAMFTDKIENLERRGNQLLFFAGVGNDVPTLIDLVSYNLGSGEVTAITFDKAVAGDVETIVFSCINECGCVCDCVGNDGVIGMDEFADVLGTWGQTGMPCDVFGDGVGIDDLLAVLGLWGPCP